MSKINESYVSTWGIGLAVLSVLTLVLLGLWTIGEAVVAHPVALLILGGLFVVPWLAGKLFMGMIE